MLNINVIIGAQDPEFYIAASLFDSYRQFYGQPSDLKAASQYLTDRLSKRQCHFLLGVRDNRAAGFVLLYPMFSSVRMAPIMILNDLYVVEAARRQGVGTALLKAACNLAKHRKMAGIQLETTADNVAAQALYESCGWRKDETVWYQGPI